MTIDKKAWTYRRDIDLHDIMSIHELITILAQTVRSEITLQVIAMNNAR